MKSLSEIKKNSIEFKNYLEKKKEKNHDLSKSNAFTSILHSFQSLNEMIQLCDFTTKEDDIVFLNKEYETIVEDLEKLKKDFLLKEKYDNNFAILEIKSSAGGKDAMGCTALISKMYIKWLKRKNYRFKITSLNSDNHDGIKNITIIVNQKGAYGILKAEHGIHKIIRQSPFNANAKRQTSFIYVESTPLILESSQRISIPQSELKIDVFRASGPGGQSVNTTDSAVRITHLKTGITVACQNERSQLQNKLTALSILESRLEQIESDARKKSLEGLNKQLKNTAWGHHIRTYIFHPYKSVKDNRTAWKTSKLENLIEGGEIDEMLQESVKAYNEKLLKEID